MSKREPRISAKQMKALRSFGDRGWRFAKSSDKPLRRLAVLGYARIEQHGRSSLAVWRLTDAGRDRLVTVEMGGGT